MSFLHSGRLYFPCWSCLALPMAWWLLLRSVSAMSYRCREMSSGNWFYHQQQGQCYAMSIDRAPWRKGKNTCDQNQAVFAKVDSLSVSRDITSALMEFSEKSVNKDKCTWLGASDKQKEGKWVWTDGEQVRFNYWEKPNLFDLLTKSWLDCGVVCLDKNNHPSWSKNLCTTAGNYPVLCHYDADVVEPKRKPKQLSTRDVYTTIADWTDHRPSTPPDWLTTAWSAAQCGRSCRGENCSMFFFIPSTRQCLSYSAPVGRTVGRIQTPGCVAWRGPAN